MKPVDAHLDPTYTVLAFPRMRRADAATGLDDAARSADIVDLSDEGAAFYIAREFSRPTFERILSLREAIATGTFETPERISGTVEHILDLIA